MDDLVQWFGEQLDEDQRLVTEACDAEFCKDGRWVAKGPFEDNLGSLHSEANEALLGEEESVPFAIAAHIAEHDPARVVREIEAKRQLVTLHSEGASELFCSNCEHEPPCPTLRLLALPYADRPGYREKWRP